MSEPAVISVLHVDDEPDVAELAAEMLEREDDLFSVETATSATEGLDRLAADDFDCIVSDYDMPGQNGIEFLNTVREEYPDLPFILFTGKGSEEVASDAISAGATDYLQKGRGTDQYELLANRIQNVVQQNRFTRRATELERIRTLRNDLNQALVRAESRAEAETRICEIISDSEPYLFAWIGEVDPNTDGIEPRTSAGIEDNYLDAITVTADDTPTGQGPGGTAIRERRVAVSQNVHEDPEFEPWRDEALERGYQAVAAVPLEYEDTLYGELVVYADRPHAFDEHEKELLVEVGADIAHAFHSFSIQTKLRRNTRAMEEAPLGITLSDPSQDDNPLIYANERFEELTGYDSAEIIGRNCRFLQGEGTDTESVAKMRQAIDAQEPVTVELTNYRNDGTEFWNRVTIAPVETEAGDVTNFVGFQETITERKQREQELEQTNTVLRTILEALPMGVLVEDAERDIHMANETLCEVVDLPVAAENLIGRDCATAADELKDLFADPDGFVNGIEERVEQREPVRNEELPLADGRTLERDYIPYTLPEGEANLWLYRDVTEKKEREEVLSTLHDATQDLITAPDKQTVAERAVETARTVLDQSINGLWLHDPDDDVLRPVTMTEESTELLGEQPIYTGGESLSWQAFEDGEIRVYDDVRTEPERLTAEPAIRSEIIVPLGEYGVMNIGATEPANFSDSDISLARILGKTVEAALDRAEREQQLRSQRTELQRQNERLEKFTSVVSHDLRNPLQVADSRVELAQDECDSDHLANVADALDRMSTLIDDLLTIAQEGEQVQETDPVALAGMVEGCWGNVQTADATLVCDTEQRIRADPSRLKQLLENLLRNAFEHTGDDVTVTVGDLDDGFYVADDGPGIPDDERAEVFDAGYSTADKGTGFGLNIVQEIAEAHGWDITVTDSKAGGARFEITGVQIDR